MTSRRENGRAAIVTTLRNAGAVLDSFIAYHRAVGFAHIFLFFDDPEDPDLARAAAMPGVTAIPHDAALRRIWTGLPLYETHGAFIEREVMSRQVLNICHAMELARRQDLGWLLNIDADELFYSPGESAAEHFAWLDGQPADAVNYLNYEALPERDEIGDFFREVTLFKVPPALNPSPPAPAAVRLLQTVPQLHPDFFHFYGLGKSAVRLSAPDMMPDGVHTFVRPGGEFRGVQDMRHFVLHYAVCGFEAFWTKYTTLGRFADRWWNSADIAAAIGSFHLEARDVVTSGDREAARRFYRKRLAMQDPLLIDILTRNGLLARFEEPARILGQEAARKP